jgi:hypothetical protein
MHNTTLFITFMCSLVYEGSFSFPIFVILNLQFFQDFSNISQIYTRRKQFFKISQFFYQKMTKFVEKIIEICVYYMWFMLQSH